MAGGGGVLQFFNGNVFDVQNRERTVSPSSCWFGFWAVDLFGASMSRRLRFVLGGTGDTFGVVGLVAQKKTPPISWK